MQVREKRREGVTCGRRQEEDASWLNGRMMRSEGSICPRRKTERRRRTQQASTCHLSFPVQRPEGSVARTPPTPTTPTPGSFATPQNKAVKETAARQTRHRCSESASFSRRRGHEPLPGRSQATSCTALIHREPQFNPKH